MGHGATSYGNLQRRGKKDGMVPLVHPKKWHPRIVAQLCRAKAKCLLCYIALSHYRDPRFCMEAIGTSNLSFIVSTQNLRNPWQQHLAYIMWNLMITLWLHQLLKPTPHNRKEIFLLPCEEVLSNRRETTWLSDHHAVPCAPPIDQDLLAFRWDAL